MAALEVFYSYAHEDEGLRQDLDRHLSGLQHAGLVNIWHDRKIGAGDEWRDEIDAHIRSAHIILFLVSPYFLASDYCYDVEVNIALARHAAHEAVVIPIILLPCDWSHAPFARLQALPRDGRPVTLWSSHHEALAQIAREIREVVQGFGSARASSPSENKSSNKYIPQQRVLDAAIPSHIVKGRATELLVLIRLAGSQGLAGVLLADEDAEARPEDVRSKPFDVVFPLGLDSAPQPVKAAVKLDSPDFSPREQVKNVLIPPDADSGLCEFMLTPIRTGQLRILVELQWEDALRGSRSLRTECIAEATSVPTPPRMNLVQIPFGVNTAEARTRSAAKRATDTVSEQPGESKTQVKVALIAGVCMVLAAVLGGGSLIGALKGWRSREPVQLTVIVSDKETQKPIAGASVTLDCPPIPKQTDSKPISTDGSGKARFYVDPKPDTVCAAVVQASAHRDSSLQIAAPIRDDEVQLSLEPIEVAHLNPPGSISPAQANQPPIASDKGEPRVKTKTNGDAQQSPKDNSGASSKEPSKNTAEPKQQTTAEVVPPKRGDSSSATPSLISIYAVPRGEPVAERVLNQIKSACFSKFPFSAAQDLNGADWVLVGNKKTNATILYLIPRRSYSSSSPDSLHKKAVWTYTVDDSNIDQEAEWACTGQGGLQEQSDLLRSQLK